MRRLRLLGHPLHPPLTHFPLALLLTAPVWDALALLGWADGTPWWTVARWVLGLGLLLAVPAAVSGLLDYAALPETSPAEGTARTHLLAAGSGIVLSAGSFLLRGYSVGDAPEAVAWTVGLGLAGAVTLGVAGWLGGELVFRHGVGVRTSSGVDGKDPVAGEDPA